VKERLICHAGRWDGAEAVEDVNHANAQQADGAVKDDDDADSRASTPPEASDDDGDASGDDYVEADGGRSKRPVSPYARLRAPRDAEPL
jgi:hypothetical protein